MFRCKTFVGGPCEPISEIIDISLDFSNAEGSRAAMNTPKKIKLPSPGELELEYTSDMKRAQLLVKYEFEADKNYFIFIKKNKWVIGETEGTQAKEFFESVESLKTSK